MARLRPGPYPDFPKEADYPENFYGLLKAGQDAIDRLCDNSLALKQDEVIGGLLRFPVADGYAYYLVVKDNPLTLQWVDFLDGYQVETALIRGLRRTDIVRKLVRDRTIHALFD